MRDVRDGRLVRCFRAFGAFLLWATVAPACLAQLPPGQGGAKVKTVTVPEIRTQQQLDRFRETVRATCGPGLTVQGNPSFAGAIRQNPASGAKMACVNQVLTLQDLPDIPPLPEALEVPTFASLADLGLFTLKATKQCNAPVPARVERAESNEPRGTRLDQRPDPGTNYKCGDQLVLIESRGPPPLLVPRFESESDLAAFADRATSRCPAPVPSGVEQRESTETPGTRLDQRPAPGTRYRCGARLTLFVSADPPPLAVPTFASEADLAAFTSLATSLCPAPVPSGVEQRESSQPRGTRLDQRPAPGTRYRCGERLTLFVSAGPPALTVPFFASPSDMRGFAKQAGAFCQQPLGSALRTGPSETISKGQRLRQTPVERSAYQCGEEISLTLSDGSGQPQIEETETSSSRDPADTPATDQPKQTPLDRVIPVPPPPVLLVPAFTSSGHMSRFAEVAAEFCGTDPSAIATAIVNEPSGEWPPGAVLEQSPQRDTTFLCGKTRLSVTLAAGTPPVWRTLLPVALASLGIAALLALAISRLVRVVPGAGRIHAAPVGEPTSPQPLLAVSLSARAVRANPLGAAPSILEGPHP